MLLSLNLFRIKNFRSIKDTGWSNLSIDNITSLVGQNESGKTSVLDGIHCFFKGQIGLDDIINYEVLPEISCSFNISKGHLSGVIKEPSFKEIVEIIDKMKRINFTRKWTSFENHEIFFEDLKIKKLFKDKLIYSENEIIRIQTTIDLLRKKINQKKNEFKNLYHTFQNENMIQRRKEKYKKVIVVRKEIKKYQNDIEPLLEKIEKINKIKSNTYSQGKFIDLIWKYMPEIVVFKEQSSLLPDRIDLADIENKNVDSKGYIGTLNFLKITGIDLRLLKSKNTRIQSTQIAVLNENITKEFQSFWTQKIGKNNKIKIELALDKYDQFDKKKAGETYLEFWIKNGNERLYLRQRSNGVRWFLSFFLQLKANSMDRINQETKLIYLIDEPGACLHANAQKDALKIFEDVKNENIQIVYTTHSPYFLDIDKIYRIIAVQRNDNDVSSDTKILDIHKLGAATCDTLTPLYSVMGIDFSHQNVIKKKNNILLEEISSFHYLKAFMNLINNKKQFQLIPLNGTSEIERFVYLFIGWGLDYYVVFDDESSSRKVYNNLKRNIFENDDDKISKKVHKIKDCKGIEDVFSKNDFKKIILQKENTQYKVSNSAYMKNSKKSKPIHALKFYNQVNEKKIKLNDFDDISKEKIKALTEKILSMID